MTDTLSNSSLPAAHEQSEPSGGCDHSRTIISALIRKSQPQHLDCCSEPDQSQTASTLAGGMSVRKRCSDSLTENTAASSNLTAAAAETVADAKLPSSDSSSIQPSNKKLCVSFCKTTKPPSLESQTQCPFLSNVQTLTRPNSNIMKHSASCSSLPQLASSSALLISEACTTGELDLSVSPSTFVQTIVLQSRSSTGSIHGKDIVSDASQRVKQDSYFLPYSDDHLEAYTTDKVNAVQGNDVETLRSLLKSGHQMQASNRFGESILHTSCRRGFNDVVEFFMNEARVSPRVRDDMGRTPMHDVCWSSAAPNHEMMKMLIRAAPEMLFSKDKRGHSPFDYARREYWPNWVTFLNEHRQFIVNSLVSSFLEESPDNFKGECIGGRWTGSRSTIG